MPIRTYTLLVLVLALFAALALGCAPSFGSAAANEWPAASDDASASDEAPAWPPVDDGPAQEGSSDASVPDAQGAPPSRDAGLDASGDALEPARDAAPDAACAKPLAAGDLAIDELLIESVAGAGDHGQWIEVQSRSSCTANLRGLRGKCSNGAKVRSFEVVGDVWLASGGTFVVADSADSTLNHDLPGPLLVWSGQPGDVLRKKGGTISLTQNGVLIDTLTYPALKLTTGASVEFPAACDPSRRSDWTAWQTSLACFYPGFFGTPNAPNRDVPCP